jgi:hypothetical protein
MTNQTEFSIVYGGDAYSDNQIDARTLGNTLTSLVNLLEHSNDILNEKKQIAEISVKAHKEGSFEILLEATGLSINTLKALGIVVSASTTVWTVLEALKGKMIAHAEFDKQSGNTKLFVENDVVECPEDVAKLITDHIVRKEIDQLVYQPLMQKNKEAIFKINSGSSNILEINQQKAISYKKTLPIMKVEDVDDEEVNIYFSKVNFYSKNGWSIILPDNKQVSALMNDESFVELINKNEASFSKDDLFVVILRTKTTKENNVVTKVSYSIQRVLRHRAAKERKIL